MRYVGSLFLIPAVLIMATVLCGCAVFGFVYQKRLIGRYELVAVDVLEQMDLCETLPDGDAVGVIPPTIFSVGWDRHFIIAKQHPHDTDGHIDRSITNFYILRASDGKLLGPLDRSAFSRDRLLLGVPGSLHFGLNFQELE